MASTHEVKWEEVEVPGTDSVIIRGTCECGAWTEHSFTNTSALSKADQTAQLDSIQAYLEEGLGHNPEGWEKGVG